PLHPRRRRGRVVDDAHDLDEGGARRRDGRLGDERGDAAARERLSAASRGAGRAGGVVGEVPAPHRGRRPALGHQGRGASLRGHDAGRHVPPVHLHPGGQVRHHLAVGWPDAARPRLLQHHRTGVVGPRPHQASGRVHGRRPQLAHRAPRVAGAAQGAHPLQHRLRLGRIARDPAEQGDRRDGPRPAEDQPAAGRAGHALHLPQQRHPVVEAVALGRGLQRAGVLMRRRARFFVMALGLGVAVSPALAGAAGASQARPPWADLGRVATPDEVRAWDIDVRGDFDGLPPGSGSVADGMEIWEAQCASCHGVFGESNQVFTPIVGGTTREDMERGRVAALADGSEPQRTTLMKLSRLSALWDYTRRAMPWTSPKSLAVDEVYAVVAYILNLGGIVDDDFVLSDRNISEVQARLPNRDGEFFYRPMWDVDGKPDVNGDDCMRDCGTDMDVRSMLPAFARDAHGNLAMQNRIVGPVRGADTTREAPKTLEQARAIALAAAAADGAAPGEGQAAANL